MMKLHHAGDYCDYRAAAFQQLPDAMDAIFRGFLALEKAGTPLPPETVAWLRACEAVKVRFPKPKV